MMGVVFIVLILIFCILPFLPIRFPFSFYWFNYPEDKRHKNIIYVATVLADAFMTVLFIPQIIAFVKWLSNLDFVRWLIDKIPLYSQYTSKIFTAVIVNILFCAVTIVSFYFVGVLFGLPRKAEAQRKKGLLVRFKEWLKKLRAKRDKNPSEEKQQHVEVKESKAEEKQQDEKAFPEHLMPEPEPGESGNKVLLKGKQPETKVEKKVKASKSHTKTDQAVEENIVKKFFYRVFSLFYFKENDAWYVQPQCKKVAKHLRNFLIITGIFYILIFVLLLIPVFYEVELWADKYYQMMLNIFDKCYLYPAISLVLLTEIFWFMNGRIAEEPVDEFGINTAKQRGCVVDLDSIEQQLMQTYGSEYEIKTFYSNDVEEQERARFFVDTSEDSVLQMVLDYTKSENITRNDDYLRGIQALQSGKNVLVDAPFYTAVSMYLFPYLNMRIAQGERMLVVSQNKENIPELIENLKEGFRRVQHAHKCLWGISDRSEIRTDNRIDVLVISPDAFLDERFYTEINDFSKRLTIVMMPDADRVISANNYLCVVMAQRLKELINSQESKFITKKDNNIQYLFLSTRHTLNLARNLSEYCLLNEDVFTVQAEYSYGSVRLYVWRAKGDSKILLDNSAQTMKLETSISNIARQNGISSVSMFTENAVFSNQIDPAWLDSYDVFDRPIGFTVVSDDSYNLPGTIYAYSRYLGKEASVLHVISKPYMLCDYFYDNAARSLFERPLMERGMAGHAQKNHTGTILLLCQLMYGMPVADFAAKMSEYTGSYVSENLTYPEICKLGDACVTLAFGTEASADKYGFYLYDKYDDNFNLVTYIKLREEGLLEHLMADTELVTVRMSINGLGKTKVIPLFKRMLAQRYLPGQHMVIDHANYKIQNIDFDNGIIFASAATSVHNVPDQYVQAREYTMHNPEEFIKGCDFYAAGEVGELSEGINGYQRRIEGKGELRSLTMVRAFGVLDIDSNTVAYYDSTNCPGRLNLMDASVFSVKTDVHRVVKNAMYLRFAGEFKRDDEVTMTLAVLLQEMMRTMFPEQHFCISVCPVLGDCKSIYEHRDEHCRRIARMYPRICNWKKAADDSIELIIIDDCEGGTGVLDMLYDPEAVYLSNILDMLCDYLDWLKNNTTDAYLYFGSEQQPAMYNFTRVRQILSPFYRPYLREHDLFQRLKPDNQCVFCEKALIAEDTYLWNNSHNICGDCDKEYVPDEKEVALILNNVRKFFDCRFGVDAGEGVCVKSDSDTDISVVDVEAKTIYLNPQLPLTAVHTEILRQVVRLWQIENLCMTGEPEFEGQVLYVALQYLEELEQYQMCKRLSGRALLSTDDVSVGYCKLRQALLSKGSDNSFGYMLEKFKKGSISPIVKTEKKRSTRKLDPNRVTRYYSELYKEKEKEVYDRILNGLFKMEPEIDVSEYQMTFSKIDEIWKAVCSEHAEIHWFSHYSYKPTFKVNTPEIVESIIPNYWFDDTERQRRDKEIEAVVDQYLEGIDDETGDFEAALKVYMNMAKKMDYDSIALDKQKRESKDHDDDSAPDELRNIYGALVQKRAVCVGYAVAYQYLLQQIGIECIVVTGDCFEGGRHAWNIVKLEGDYYHVDVTWGDGSNTDPTKHREEPSFGYFCLTDQEIGLSRTVDEKPSVPVCSANYCNYFVRNGLFFSAYDHLLVKERLVSLLNDKKKNRLDLRFSNSRVLQAARNQLVSNGGLSEVLRASGRKGRFSSYSDSALNIFSAFFEAADGFESE